MTRTRPGIQRARRNLRTQVAVLCLLGWSAGAHAQPAGLGLRDPEAQRLASDGLGALTRGDGGSAVQSLERAFQREPAVALLEPLGRAAQASGDRLRAADLFQRFLALAPPELSQPKRAALQPVIDAAQAEACTLFVSGDVGAVLRVDGRIVGTLPLGPPLLLACGSRTVRADLGPVHQDLSASVAPDRPLLLQFDFKGGLPPLSERPPAVLLSSAGLEPGARQRLETAVATVLPDEHVVLLSQRVSDAALALQPRLHDCLTQPQCQLELAQLTDAQFMLELTALPKRGAWRLRIVDAVITEQLGATDIDCPDCTDTKLGTQVAQAAQRLVRDALGRTRGTLALSSQPASAELLINDQPRGQTPAKLAVLSGMNRIKLQKKDYLPVEQTVDVSPGQTVTLVLPLRADPAVARRRLTAAKWALFGVGATALVAGAVLAGLEGQGFCGAGTMCPQVWDGIAGVAPLVVGGLAWGGAAALWGVERKMRAAESPAR